jgi:hypothetical protein
MIYFNNFSIFIVYKFILIYTVIKGSFEVVQN